MERLICIAVGYLFGLIQTSYIYGRMNGIDIREHGSGNAGTTNMLRTLGRKAGIITFFGDAFKCVFAVMAVYLIFGKQYEEIFPLLKIYTAAGVILGHNFPFYLGFRGGKGVAATAGLLLVLHPVLTLIAAVLFFGTLFTTHYVSLGSLLVYAFLMTGTVVFGQNGVFGMTQPYLNEMYAVTAFLTVMAYWKHRANIGRLLAGKENKTYLSKKK